MIAGLIAAALLILGCLAIYLATPHQQLRPTKAPPWLAILGAAAIIIALLCLFSVMGPATAVFTLCIGLMFLWSIPPVIIAWLRYRKKGAVR